LDTWSWITNLTHQPISKFLGTYLTTAMFISSPPKLKRTILMSSPHRVTSLEENNINIGILPGRMQLFPSGKTTLWEHRWSVIFPQDMLSQRCISHRPIVLILTILVSTSAEKIIWPVKIVNQSTGRMKWVNLHEDEPTVRTFVKETLANEQ
jgi:hypothetical protein